MTTKKIGYEGLFWFIGKVEDISNDPLQIGRIKVRVLNEQTETNITVDDLIWAIPLLPVTSASTNQNGISPVGIQIGAIVIGFFIDGKEKQMPMIWGTYTTQNNMPKLVTGTNTIPDNLIGPEPKSAYNAKYPYNWVYKTPAGHVIEVDDTPSSERIRMYHKSGSYVEINNTGRTVIKSVDDKIEINANNNTVYVSGDKNVVINGKYTVNSSSITLNGNVNINGNLIVSDDVIASNISLTKHTHPIPNGNTGLPQ